MFQSSIMRKKFFYHIYCLILVFLICSSITCLSLFLHGMGIDIRNLLMLFLIGVLLSTVVTHGYLYGFITAFLGVFLFNYFFTEPLHTFAISNKQDVLLITFFLLAALICGLMSSQFQRQTKIAQKNEHMAHLMYEITESFLNLAGTEHIIDNAKNYLSGHAGTDYLIQLDQSKFENCENCFYSGAVFEPEHNTCFLPIKGLSTQIGSVYFAGSLPKEPGARKLIYHIVYQMALVLDREYLYLEREKIRLAMESEHLKSTLLRSISHDIRTPLTGIMGASSVITENISTLSSADIARLAADIAEESSWLIMTVQNILDMTRISDGKLAVNTEYEAVDDLVNQAVSRLPSSYDRKRLSITMPETIFLIKADGTLFVQVLVNLLDNAYKHSTPDSRIFFRVFRKDEHIVFELSDNGCGIDPNILPDLFHGFVTHPAQSADKGRGVGLGLFICQEIIQAHGGSIAAANRPAPEHGAVFTILFPYQEV